MLSKFDIIKIMHNEIKLTITMVAWVLPWILLLLLVLLFFDLLRGWFERRRFVGGVGFRRRRRWWWWTRKVDCAVDARGAFGLDPSFNVELGETHDPTTRTESTDHTRYDAEKSDDSENRYDGSNRPVTRMGRVGLLGQFYGWWWWWWLLHKRCGHWMRKMKH